MVKKIKKNNLQQCREEAGLTKAALFGLSGISTLTIRDIEEHKREGNNVTRHSLVNGLNKSNFYKHKPLEFRDVFPK